VLGCHWLTAKASNAPKPPLFNGLLGAQGEAELADPQLHPARRRVLESLGEHWTGLTVFVEHPEVPLDNNTAERAQRGPVVGRKNLGRSSCLLNSGLF